MEKKIEKLEGSYDVPQLKQKLNEIIDHLNTQPQAGEYPQKAKYISGEVPEEKKALVQLRRVFDKKRVKEWDRIAMETYKQATQSTPEQKEEGSYVLTYKNLKEIMTLMEEQGLNTVSIEYLMQYCGYPIKNLLLDREREAQIEVLTDIFQNCYQEDSKTLELVEEKLSKLTTK